MKIQRPNHLFILRELGPKHFMRKCYIQNFVLRIMLVHLLDLLGIYTHKMNSIAIDIRNTPLRHI